MKVLWLCNSILPRIAEHVGLQSSPKEGWVSGMANWLLASGEVEMAYCFPVYGERFPSGTTQVHALFDKGMAGELTYYAFREDTRHPERMDSHLEERLRAIVEDYQPDLVHIFGTEYAHSLAMTRAYRKPDHTLIGMQGVCKYCADVYLEAIPQKVIRSITFRDILRRDSLRQQKKKFAKRAVHEQAAILGVGHVAGRTKMDQAFVKSIHPEVEYHYLGENLRPVFYERAGEWRYDKAVPHSLFVAQGNYPIKGLHVLLQALVKLRQMYPDLTVAVAGDCITKYDTIGQKIKISGYGRYLRRLLKEGDLMDCVTFAGMLSAEEMVQQYLQSMVCVCPSLIENSPNTVGEAMLLGTPVVAAEVGGIPDMLQEGGGIMYQGGDIEDLVSAVSQIFACEQLARELSSKGQEVASIRHNPQQNHQALLEIYRRIG